MAIYGLAIAAANRSIDVIIMKCISGSACLKLLGSRVLDILIQLPRNSKIIQTVLVALSMVPPVMHGTKKRQKTDDLYHICIYDFPINVIFIIYILHHI